jgi:hypothetical protein
VIGDISPLHIEWFESERIWRDIWKKSAWYAGVYCTYSFWMSCFLRNFSRSFSYKNSLSFNNRTGGWITWVVTHILASCNVIFTSLWSITVAETCRFSETQQTKCYLLLIIPVCDHVKLMNKGTFVNPVLWGFFCREKIDTVIYSYIWKENGTMVTLFLLWRVRTDRTDLTSTDICFWSTEPYVRTCLCLVGFGRC